MEPLLTLSQVARVMRVRADTVQQWVTAGLLPTIDVGTSRRRSLRVTPEAVRQLCETLRVTPKKPAPRGRRKAEPRKDYFPDLP